MTPSCKRSSPTPSPNRAQVRAQNCNSEQSCGHLSIQKGVGQVFYGWSHEATLLPARDVLISKPRGTRGLGPQWLLLPCQQLPLYTMVHQLKSRPLPFHPRPRVGKMTPGLIPTPPLPTFCSARPKGALTGQGGTEQGFHQSSALFHPLLGPANAN